MNATEKKLMTLYHEYFPYLRKSKNYLPSCSDEYLQDGNIRLLFGYFKNERTDEYLGSVSFGDMIDISHYKDSAYDDYSFENNEIKEFYYSNAGEEINVININRNVNGDRKNNFIFIQLNPFGSRPENITEQDFECKKRDFIIAQINILQPDAVVIGCVSDDSNDESDVDIFKNVFGKDIILYPIQFPPNFIKKYELENENLHLLLIKGIKELKIPIYVFKWDIYNSPELVKDFLKIISENIIKNIKKH